MTIERGLETITSHRNEHKTQSLLQCLGVLVHGVEEHGKGDSSRCSPRFFPSCQPALKLGPNLAMSAG